jgi:nitrogen fixation protein FixH
VDLVSADYYEQELKFQGQLDRLNRTSRLGAKASAAYDPAKQCITLSLPPGETNRVVTGHIHLYRPSAAGLDRELDLQTDTAGKQNVNAANLLPGRWKVRVSWTADNQDYYLDQEIIVPRPQL